jgi:hypothetical protein
MAIYAGFGGKITISAVGGTQKQLPNVGEWEIEYENEMLEAEIMGNKTVKREYGLGAWEGSMTLYFDYTDVPDTDADKTDHKEVIQAALNKTKMDVTLYTDADSTMKIGSFSGTILISKFNVKSESNELIELEVEFSGDGDLTYDGDSAA